MLWYRLHAMGKGGSVNKLRACYAISGTDPAYGARVWYWGCISAYRRVGMAPPYRAMRERDRSCCDAVLY
eukprot:1678070-Rhodomonas_salina.1